MRYLTYVAWCHLFFPKGTLYVYGKINQRRSMSLLHLESLKALATATARAAKTSSLTQFRVFPNFLKINPATMEFRIKRNFFWSVILGHPTQLYKTGHKEISRRSRAVVTAKKQSEKGIHLQS